MLYPKVYKKAHYLLIPLAIICTPCAAQAASSSSSSCSSSSAPSQSGVTPALQCTVHSIQPWAQGYNANIDITNIGTQAIDSWEVYLRLAQGHSVNHHWNSVVEPGNGGVVTVKNAHWNGSLLPGQTTNIGILGAHPGTYIEPLCSITPLPQANLTVQAHGLTVQASSSETLNPGYTYTLNFGDGHTISHPNAWHTYDAPGEYEITLTVSDGEQQSTKAQTIVVTDSNSSNNPPVADIFYDVSDGHVSIANGLSYDPDGDTLTKESSHTLGDGYRLEVLTVFDGELGDTTSAYIATGCGYYYHEAPTADYSYSLTGRTLTVDARNSRGAYLLWEFGDGSQSSDVVTHHSFAEPGTYEVTLAVYGYPNRKVEYFNVTVP